MRKNKRVKKAVRRVLRKIKNTILIAITYFAMFICLAVISAIDSISMLDLKYLWIPVVAFIVSGMWLILFGYANQQYLDKWEKGEV